ncbi:MAG: regulatory protein RecX [Gallionella sp.]
MRKKHELSLRARALQYLARREYSRAELHGKLSRYVITDADLDPDPDPDLDLDSQSVGLAVDLNTLLDDLEARDWLSDERAAKQWIRAKGNRFGTQRIVYDLRQKGISEELIENALPAMKEGELAAAREVWQKKFGVLPVDQNEKAKQMRFLQSRGFNIGVILKIFQSESE